MKFDGNADALDPNASIELSLTSAAEPKVAPEIVTSTSAAVAAPIPEQTEAPPPPPRVAEPVEVPQDALVPRPPIAIDAMIFVLASIVLAILAKKIIHVLVSSGTESAVSSL